MLPSRQAARKVGRSEWQPQPASRVRKPSPASKAEAGFAVPRRSAAFLRSQAT